MAELLIFCSSHHPPRHRPRPDILLCQELLSAEQSGKCSTIRTRTIKFYRNLKVDIEKHVQEEESEDTEDKPLIKNEISITLGQSEDKKQISFEEKFEGFSLEIIKTISKKNNCRHV